MPKTVLLAGAAAIFCGLSLLGWRQDLVPEPAVASHALPQVTAAKPAAPTDRPASEYVATILARPLFAEGRVPVVLAPAGPKAEAALPRLTAIVAAPGLRRAIFATRGSTHTVSAAEGDPLGAFHIVAIGAGTVELDGAAGRKTLRLESDQAYRATFTEPPPLVPLVDPVRREAELENDQ